MKKLTIHTSLFILLTFLSTHSLAQIITDIDGNTYNTITIGTQTWIKGNLKTTHFSNGDEIATTSLAINNVPASIYQWPYDDDMNNVDIYGRLYTWYAATDSRNVCPTGWHVPGDEEWMILSDFLGGDSIAGAKMKEAGIEHWNTTDNTVDNSSGFTGIGAGARGNPMGFINLNSLGSFWSATPLGTNPNFQRGYVFHLNAANDNFTSGVAVANYGASIRCLQNIATDTKDLQDKNQIKIYPNPAIDQFIIALENSGEAELTIYDLSGIPVLKKQLHSKVNNIDIAVLANGIYTIRIIGSNLETTQKLIKQ